MHRKRRLHEYADPGTVDGPRRVKQRCVPPIKRPIPHSMTARNPLGNVFKNLNKLRVENKLCDWIIQTNDNVEFPAHSVVLTFSSPYFEKTYTETSRCDSSILKTTLDLPGTVLKDILDFIYTGKCTLHQETLFDVLKAANEYLFIDLIQECYTFITNQIEPENCVSFYQLTTPYFSREISENLLQYICQHFREVLLKSREILDLSAEEMVTTLSRDDLNVADEGSLFLFVERWIDQDIVNRETHALDLLKCLRFGLMDKTFMDDRVMVSRYVTEHPSVQEYLSKGEEISTHESGLCKQRISSDIVFVIGGWTERRERNHCFVEVFDKCANRWFPMKHLTPPHTEFYYYSGACVLLNLVYILGGYCNASCYSNTSMVMCFDPNTQLWEEKACMNEARSLLVVVALDGHIYAIGGIDEFSILESAERFSPKVNQWTMIAPMNVSRRMAGATAFNGKIYVAGGYDNNRSLSSVEVYNADTNQWSFIPQMLSPRYGLCVIAFQDAIYALGGDFGDDMFSSIGNLNTVERYDPSNDQRWSYVEPMTKSRKNFAAFVLDDKVYAIGGSDSSYPLTPVGTTECFGEIDCIWHWTLQEPELFDKRWGHSVCVVSGVQNAKEYSYEAYCAREETECSTQSI